MMRRGEIRVASFKPWRGKEIGKARPCLIMQADWLTTVSPGTLIVLPLTSQLWQGADMLRVAISPRERLRKPSWVMIDKIQTLDASRFGDGPLAALNEPEMSVIEQKLQAVLGML
ncbi:MAG: type II toxin-antitoxin system PemK/MazF family toxin [Gammaproteobacteria bacterium]|nr:type II toxin-antitoxin system PemK/MazF family toxin [Gammaproteobacteria bacterium]